jgi:hypothetical protein
MEENYLAKIAPDVLERSFRHLLAADRARQALRHEAALYVLLNLDASTVPQPSAPR